MTAYALRLENATDTAARVRAADALGLTPVGKFTARQGVRPAPGAGDVAVSAGTMQVTVQPFAAWIDGGVSDTQGGYPFVSDAVETLTLDNGHATLSRTDVIAAVVHDNAFDGSGSTDAAVVVITGTAGAGVPALPSNCLPLRNVTVPAGASLGTGGLTSGNLSTDRRTYTAALGGVVPVSSQSERDALPAVEGALCYRLDTNTWEGYNGAAWAGVAGAGTYQSGTASHTYAGATQTQTLSYTFPTAFDSAPKVTMSWADERFTCAVKNITATGFDVTSYYLLGAALASFALQITWHAHL